MYVNRRGTLIAHASADAFRLVAVLVPWVLPTEGLVTGDTGRQHSVVDVSGRCTCEGVNVAYGLAL